MDPDFQRRIKEIISELEYKSSNGDYIYRGEPEDYGKVSSSLWREFGLQEGVFDIEVVQKEMLSAAKQHLGEAPQDFTRSFNVRQDDSDIAVDFEILTEIQHYGGKTNLIDFTTDYSIALFFACDGHHDACGRVVLLQTEAIQNMIVHPWNPRHRVIAQRSIFVRPPHGFIEPREEDLIIVPADLKRWILQHLRKYHGISTVTIYNDLHGYIRHQDIHGGAYTQFQRGFACQDRADRAPSSEAKMEEYEKSIEFYTKAIKLKPDFVEAFFNRGLTYSRKHEFDYAIDDYTKAIDLKPDLAEPYNSRGLAYRAKREFKRAIDDFNRAIHLKPNYASGYYNRGLVYKDKGEVNRAIDDYFKAIDLDPDYAEAYTDLGLAFFDGGDVQRAIEHYAKAISLRCDYAPAYNNRGVAYAKKERYENAIADYTKAIDLNPTLSAPYYNRGNAYYSTGNYEHAIADYDRVIELDPENDRARNRRAAAQRQLSST